MRLALRSSVLPNPLVAMTMNLSSRSGVRKPSISGVRWRSDSSKSSATRMSSASTVQARISSRSFRREGQSIVLRSSPVQPRGSRPWLLDSLLPGSALEGRSNLGHEAGHLLLDLGVGFQADVEVQDHFVESSRFDLLQGLGDAGR